MTLDTQIKTIYPENIPTELKNLHQWVLWTYQEQTDKEGNPILDKEGNPKKPTKVPLQPNGKLAASDNENTWYTFEEVYNAFLTNDHFAGIGFMFKPPYVGFDMDNAIDHQSNEIDPTTLYIIGTLKSYTEISPSGNGFHTIVKINKPFPLNRSKKLGDYECYEEKRFFTFTGNTYAGLTNVEWRDDPAHEIVQKIFIPKAATQNQSAPATQSGQALTKDQVYKVMKRSKNAQRINLLLQGDYSEYASHSEASFALLNHLAYFTRKDAALMEEIYCESGMYTPDKWHRKQNGTYFGALEIQNAIAKCKKVYEPRKSNKQNSTQPIQSNNPINPLDPIQMVREELQRDENGKILKNAYNVLKILDSKLFQGVLGYDEFRQREVIFKALPWRDRHLKHKNFEQWQASDDAQLRHFLRLNFNISNKDMIMDTLTHVFQKKSFHPVKNYIAGIPWDRVPRLETFFVDYLGAEDTQYTRDVSRKWFVAAVKRIYEPGCKFDYMPVLVGDQGLGKSTAIQKLAPNFFNDSLRNFDIKESGEILQGSWIVEIGELAAMKKSDEDELKGFLSRQVDTFRPAYARTAQDFPRHCVFMGTTNNYEFLRDNTGNRRFLPIQTSKNRKYVPWNDLDEMTVRQLWAEAFILYKQGEDIDLSEETKEAAKRVQLQFTESDVKEGVVYDYLNMPLPIHWDSMTPYERRTYFDAGKWEGKVQRQDVCVMEIWRECFGESGEPTRMDSKRIIGILTKLGWQPRKPVQKRFKHYSIQRAYVPM